MWLLAGCLAAAGNPLKRCEHVATQNGWNQDVSGMRDLEQGSRNPVVFKRRTLENGLSQPLRVQVR